MKKLLKSGIYGSVNSARVHCSQLTWSNSAAEREKKKKKTGKRNNAFSHFQRNPNAHIVCAITSVCEIFYKFQKYY